MRKLRWALPFLLLVFLIGCTQHHAVSPVDRALTFNTQYDALELTYKNQYREASDFEKEWLRENVAPIIDKLRLLVLEYSRYAVMGADDIDTRIEIIQLARKAALKLAEEVTDED
jgi:hypothetical protein